MLSTKQHSMASAADQAHPADLTPRKLQVLVVDDHAAVRMGLMALLHDEPDIDVVNAVSNAEAAISFAERVPVDVAVVDYQLGSRSGLWLSRMLKRLVPPPRVVIYSAYSDGPLAAACVVAEADGLLSKGSVGAELCHAVRAAAQGRARLPAVPPALAGAMRRRLASEDQAIFGMLLAGITADDIAETLNLSPQAVDRRMWAMLHKLERLGSETVAAGPSHGPRTRAHGTRSRSAGC
jgi:DNA-binding NarL/FixJ family response regulator